ncbi:MAG: CotS family spore coat protein [Alicyclobacillus herbarius]|uniref:CotS family spore coat protein n=1 Tax=Alicyclobacillus herbarius TaxID=122960 RepID=UPI0023522E1E|nr:CotS family spore coat protein [Alicyclobacillus herbarius]MCL6632664.1 CotS family spore coat protein [Alicyclobacillus herbarius]
MADTIGPWIDRGYPDPDMTVPPEVLKAAEKVIARYDMRVKDMTLITAKSDKGGAIWKLQTDKGPRSLKLLHRNPERSRFAVAAQDYLVHRKARVPTLIKSRMGRLYSKSGGKLWIVTEWIEPLQPVSKVDLAGAQALCYGLGEFHRRSQGYVAPRRAVHASRLYRWEQTYHKMAVKIGWFRVLAQVYKDVPGSEALLSAVDKYEAQAVEAYKRLQASPYRKLIRRGEPAWGLAHQDYGWSNGQMGPEGLWIIDLDGVAYDLPIRDLRKLISSTMEDAGNWNVDWIQGMIKAYREANPVEPDVLKVLWVDFSLPNEFYKNVKEMVFRPAEFMQTELAPVLAQVEKSEASKWQALKELRKWLGVSKS